MKRNQSILQFQKRLIRTAMMSPRSDAMNLLGIVYSNIKEFIEVRVARDEEPDNCMDELIETIDIWAKAVYGKFPNLCETISYVPSLTYDERCEVGKRFLMGEKGFINDGRYFHRYVGLGEIEDRRTPEEIEVSQDEYNMCGVNLIAYSEKKIATPKDPMTNSKFAKSCAKALESKDIPSGSFGVYITTRSIPQEDQHNLVFITRDREAFESFDTNGYTISFKYPIMIEFDHVAATIVKYYQGQTENRVCYESPPTSYHYEDLYDRVMTITEASTKQLYRLPAIMAPTYGPKIENRHATAVDILTGTNSPMTYDHFGGDHSEFIQQMKECWMTIYRTDDVDDDEYNVSFILKCGKQLGAKAHIYIEGRARSSEKNNLKLYRHLEEYKADVHIIPHHENAYDKKVHAKIWLFDLGEDNRIVLTSTGNFSMAAQSHFRDTLYLRRDVSQQEFNEYIAMFDTILSGAKYNNNPKSSFVWQPKLIRERLDDEIDTRINLAKLSILAEENDKHASASQQFIWIKANHVIDPDMNQKITDAAKTDFLEVHVIARTACTLPLSIPYMDYEVRSISGKYLEHDRFYIFGHYDENDTPIFDTVFISSCDIMKRNLKDRIEYIQKLDDENANRVGVLFQKMFAAESDPTVGFFNYELTNFDDKDNILTIDDE